MTSLPSPREDAIEIFRAMGIKFPNTSGGSICACSPIDGAVITELRGASPSDIDDLAGEAANAFVQWRVAPPPIRGELVRHFGELLRKHKEPLGRLVTLESGKPISEGLGEVQEMIDICDFAVGLSRQLYGLTIASERPEHRLTESWHPLGPVAIISAFNFPVAVWAWNAAIALVCGNAIIWKPSEKTPLTAIAAHTLLSRAIADFGAAPEGLSGLALGDGDVGAKLAAHDAIAMISATGSTEMGRKVGARAAETFKRSLLELGGNNAAIVAPTADLELTLRAVLFAAFGASGQRCTSLRRLFLHEDIYEDFLERLKKATSTISIGDPREPENLMGPLIDESASIAMDNALDETKSLGGDVHGGERLECEVAYRRPAIVEMPAQTGPVLRETFAPIVYCMPYRELEDAISMQNAVGAGLSASLFTNDVREEGLFLSAAGADTGIANVNIGTSGAEIGGAFGGEKETGGGRESGSDAWKSYMRRSTQTVNYGTALPLAQGVEFNVD